MSISGITASWIRVRRFGFAVFCCVPVLLFAESTNGVPVPDRVVSRCRIGPFFEHSTTRDGGSFWAFRPFYSKVNDPVDDTRITDVVWPFCTFHRAREQAWWRVVLAYGSDLDVHRDDSAWSEMIFPVYFSGRTRQGEDYRALFPISGHIPHMLLMEDIDFALFPVHLDYKVNGVEREYYLWPIFSHMAEEKGVKRTGVFPISGTTRREGECHSYRFWPFWTSAVYENGRNSGDSWMLFPLYGAVDREKEQQWLFLPPFFSHAKTDSADRWRMPWPFYETEKRATLKKRSYWPFYGDIGSEDEHRWYAVWPLIESFSLTSRGRRTERSRFFPFYVGETVYARDAAGNERVKETYTRLWPFFSRETNQTESRLRALEFTLIRYSGGIERNWAPFWTVYERVQRGDETEHDVLWGLYKSHTMTRSDVSKENVP